MTIYIIHKYIVDYVDYPVEYHTDLVQAKYRNFILNREVKIYENWTKELTGESHFIRELEQGPTVEVIKKK